MSIPTGGAIQGVVGKVVAGTALLNAFIVAFQKLDYDVKGTDNVAFVFAYRGLDSVDLRADITDHFIEDNTAVQDQIALRPKEITLHGFIGELGDVTGDITSRIQQIANQLTVLAPYVPQLTVQALQAYNQAQQIYNTAASAASSLSQAYSIFSGSTFQTKQMKAYGYFENKFNNRALFSVQTPWAIFENMTILSLRAVQDEESQSVSDFTITFKQLNFATTVASSKTILDGRLSAQAAPQVSQGIQNPTSAGSINLASQPLSQPAVFHL